MSINTVFHLIHLYAYITDFPPSTPALESREASPLRGEFRDQQETFFEVTPSFRSQPAFNSPQQPLTAVFSPEAFEAESKGKFEEQEEEFVSEEPPWTRYGFLLYLLPT